MHLLCAKQCEYLNSTVEVCFWALKTKRLELEFWLYHLLVVLFLLLQNGDDGTTIFGGQNTAPRDVCLLIRKTSGYVMPCGKTDVADIIKVTDQ